jgi:acyl carrier protein
MASQEAIQNLIIGKLATILRITPEQIDPQTSIFSCGLDSSGALSLTGQLEDELAISLDPAMFWQHPNITDLSQQVSQLCKSQGASIHGQ